MNTVEQVLQNLVLGNNSPSVQYVLFDKANIIKKLCYGLADISGNKSANDNTSYNAYSVTKTFTALAIMQLTERKLIDLDQFVASYLPEFPYSEDIIVRQILTHSAGIPNPIPLNWIHLTSEHNIFDNNTFFKEVFVKYSKTKFEPNGKFAYSNLGYVLLGELIEKVTKLKYEQYIRANIISQLRTSNEELGFEIVSHDLHARGYHKRVSLTDMILGFFIDKTKFMGKTEGKWKPFNSFYVNGTAYGGLVGTPLAFVKYIQELLKPDSLLLSDECKTMLFTENHIRNQKATGMCLSWFTGQLNGKRYFAHAGGGGGYYCEIRLYPNKGIGSVIILNRTGMSDERLLNKLDKFYFEAGK